MKRALKMVFFLILVLQFVSCFSRSLPPDSIQKCNDGIGIFLIFAETQQQESDILTLYLACTAIPK
ncbi:hypothetical protein DLM75_23795 [Leptospira stimsonii]|uniref:Uncharacterized protein n=1 Tax=Leptospira stimsonii TaxID=2202203 RepID=A0A396YKL4_9LEPT|nr:hypothetical protein DLM75_23795 [Leptospira stimsonii]